MLPPSSPAASLPSAAPEPASLEGALRLADWGVIRARGEDAASFLQSQLTNDVLGLGTTQARLAGYCSAKGRLLASFVIWRDEAGDFLLACSADLLASTLKRLSMFVLRAKCKLSDASAEVPLTGLAGAAALHALGTVAPRETWAVTSMPAGGNAIRLPDAHVAGLSVPRVLLAGSAAPAVPALDEAAWRWLEVKSGTARIVTATVDQFVPQMVNLELVGGVNFQKGCYPGQEIVARSQYRGTLKRRAYVLSGDAAMRPGQEVFAAADPGQPAGMVVLAGAQASARAGAHAALVELKIAASVGGALHLGSADGPPLLLDALPYALPSAAA